MKLLLAAIDWEYPPERKIPAAQILDLADKKRLMDFYLWLANGIVLEMHAEADSTDALEVLQAMITNVGAGRRFEPTPSQLTQFWLYQDGDECYQQGSDKSPGYFFVKPTPQPARFTD